MVTFIVEGTCRAGEVIIDRHTSATSDRNLDDFFLGEGNKDVRLVRLRLENNTTLTRSAKA